MEDVEDEEWRPEPGSFAFHMEELQGATLTLKSYWQDRVDWDGTPEETEKLKVAVRLANEACAALP